MHHETNAGLFGTMSIGSFISFFQGLYAYGPSWAVLPPLIVGLAGLVGAVNALREGEHRRDMERRRFDAERERAAAYATMRKLGGLSFDQVEGQN